MAARQRGLLGLFLEAQIPSHTQDAIYMSKAIYNANNKKCL